METEKTTTSKNKQKQIINKLIKIQIKQAKTIKILIKMLNKEA